MSRRRGRRSGGQALVEFALVLPIFLVMVFGILDMGRAVWALDVANHAAAEGARFAIVHGGSQYTECPVGPQNGAVPGPTGSSSSCPFPSPSKQSIYNAASNAAIGAGPNVIVTACYGDGCQGDADVADNAPGNLVTVRVTVHVQIFSGALLGISDMDVTGAATMTVSN